MIVLFPSIQCLPLNIFFHFNFHNCERVELEAKRFRLNGKVLLWHRITFWLLMAVSLDLSARGWQRNWNRKSTEWNGGGRGRCHVADVRHIRIRTLPDQMKIKWGCNESEINSNCFFELFRLEMGNNIIKSPQGLKLTTSERKEQLHMPS